MDLKKIIANNIYILRSQHNLTQEEFAKKLGKSYTRGHISHVETGRNMPSTEFIYDVSTKFGVDPKWILEVHNTKYPDVELSAEEISFALKYRKLPNEAQKSVQSIIDIILQK